MLINCTLGCCALAHMVNHGGGHRAELGTATLKCPHSWGPEGSGSYPFQGYFNDVILKTLAADMEWICQGPAVAMQLTSTARLVYRQLMEEPHRLVRLQQGERVPDGQYFTGVVVLLSYIGLRFVPLEIELTTQAMTDMMSFRRRNGETFDQMLARLDMEWHRAMKNGMAA